MLLKLKNILNWPAGVPEVLLKLNTHLTLAETSLVSEPQPTVSAMKWLEDVQLVLPCRGAVDTGHEWRRLDIGPSPIDP